MTAAELQQRVERLAPAVLAEEWDNVGLLVGRIDAPVTSVLVALELRAGVLAEAVERGCEALVLHHPPIFSPRSVSFPTAARAARSCWGRLRLASPSSWPTPISTRPRADSTM